MEGVEGVHSQWVKGKAKGAARVGWVVGVG